MIRLENISKEFIANNQTFKAVDNVSLDIPSGQILGIIGYSGAGKSTLVRIINQLTKQDQGNVIIDESNLSELSEKEMRITRQKIGMIFQHFNLMWSKTVSENIELPLIISKVNKKERKKKIAELLDLVGLKDKANSYPKELSGGQKQRVAIARALANNPSILLCDEATSALDPKTTEDILNLLKTINEKYQITMVVITHQMEVAQKICHEIVVMTNGKIIEKNNVTEIFANPKEEITKSFIQNIDTTNLNKITEELISLYPKGKLVRLTFTGGLTSKAILSKAIKLIDIDVNIVFANINLANIGPLGSIYCLIEDKDHQKYEDFITYLVSEKVNVEVIR